ncbi:hypothetical protein H2200_005832 [Cladophialophora chaetospira]|uniref:Uncharacterized protein n=1 Tax=Cladophialophora chaetospira TaxID=386627 RepID=A0AA38XAC6_9EURO|nr:hypothetical protein H2200_005832 [Cladophialophora chaetospira]
MQSSYGASEVAPYGNPLMLELEADEDAPSSNEPAQATSQPTPQSTKPSKKPPKKARPLTKDEAESGDTARRYSLAQRVQTLTLLSLGYTTKQVEAWIKVPSSAALRMRYKAQERGWNPAEDPRILDYHVEDGKRTGRPRTRAPGEKRVYNRRKKAKTVETAAPA